MAVTILMLQSLAGESGSARGSTQQESTDAHVGCGPDQIPNALEAEHRVINKERDCIDAMVGVRATGSDERADRSGFSDAFFKNLPVFRFFVIQQRVHIDGLIELADAGINSHLTKQSFHTEGASFIWDDGNDQFSNLGIAQQLRQQSYEDHGGRNFAALGTFIKFFEVRFIDRLNWLGTHFPRRHVTTQLLPPFLHVANFSTVVRWTVKRRVMQIFIWNWNSESRAEHAQLVFIELLLLVSDIFAFASFTKSVAFNGFRQNHCRRTLVFDRGFVRRMDFDRIMTAKSHARHLLV